MAAERAVWQLYAKHDPVRAHKEENLPCNLCNLGDFWDEFWPIVLEVRNLKVPYVNVRKTITDFAF